MTLSYLLLAAKDGADAAKEIADDVAGSDTRAIHGANHTNDLSAGTVVDGRYDDF